MLKELSKGQQGWSAEDEAIPGRTPAGNRWHSQVRKHQECLIKLPFTRLWAGCPESIKDDAMPWVPWWLTCHCPWAWWGEGMVEWFPEPGRRDPLWQEEWSLADRCQRRLMRKWARGLHSSTHLWSGGAPAVQSPSEVRGHGQLIGVVDTGQSHGPENRMERGYGWTNSRDLPGEREGGTEVGNGQTIVHIKD